MKSLRAMVIESGPNPDPNPDPVADPAAGADEEGVHLLLKVLTSTAVDARAEGSTTQAIDNILEQHEEHCARKQITPTVKKGENLRISLGGGVSDSPWSTDPSVKNKPLNSIISGGPKVPFNQNPVFLSRMDDEDEVERLLKQRGVISDELLFFSSKPSRRGRDSLGGRGSGLGSGLGTDHRNKDGDGAADRRYTRHHYFRAAASHDLRPSPSRTRRFSMSSDMPDSGWPGAAAKKRRQ